MSIYIIYNYFVIPKLQREYTKQKKETIANYRGFQTMDARKHPDVTKAAKANALTSNVSPRFWQRSITDINLMKCLLISIISPSLLSCTVCTFERSI